MVTLRSSTRRAARASTSATRASRPIPATSVPDPPIPVPFGANPSHSTVPVQSFIPRETFDFDGVQYSPYYLTNGDNPGTSLISEVLDGSNFNTWNLAITIALEAKNKIAFVDGSLPRPSANHPHYRIWSRCNSMVKSWILNSVTKSIYGSILRFSDASEIWKDLTSRFHITNLPRSYQLTQQIWSLQQGNTDLSTYYTKLKTLWDDLDGADCIKTCQNCNCCKATATKMEHTKIIKFLAGLNESYANARGQIIMKKNVLLLVKSIIFLTKITVKEASFQFRMLLLFKWLRQRTFHRRSMLLIMLLSNALCALTVVTLVILWISVTRSMVTLPVSSTR